MLDKIDDLVAEIKETKENDIYSLVLLGRNGDGKSFLVNLLVSLTCPTPDHYGFACENEASLRMLTRSRSRSRAYLESRHLLQEDPWNRLEALSFLKELWTSSSQPSGILTVTTK